MKRYLVELAIIFSLAFVFLLDILNIPSFSSSIQIGQRVVLILTTLFIGYQGLKELLKKRISVELMAAIALGTSIYFNELDSAIFISSMLIIARITSKFVENRTNVSLQSLLKVKPNFARRINEIGDVELITPSEIEIGNRILIESGENIPVDGVVDEYIAEVDQSAITGESLPTKKEVSDSVYAGTTIFNGRLLIRATTIEANTSIQQIVKILEQARSSKTRQIGMAERFTAIYLTLITGISFLFFFITKDVNLVLGLLLVVCADDIAVAVPLTYIGAIRLAAKKGVLIKTPEIFESLNKLTHIFTDKTGTLTQGKLTISKVIEFKKLSPMHKQIILTLTKSSTHPISVTIAKLIERDTKFKRLPNLNSIEVKGFGIKLNYQSKWYYIGSLDFVMTLNHKFTEEKINIITSLQQQGSNTTLFFSDNEIFSVFCLEDKVKPEAKESINEIKKLGITNITLLSGDNSFVVNKVAKHLNITNSLYEVKPDEKYKIIRETTKSNITAMLGDGLNDSPALASATVGIAMGIKGSDISIQSAGVVLMNDSLKTIPWLIKFSRFVNMVSLMNFGLWVVLNSIGIYLVLSKQFAPKDAALYNFLTDFIPLANAARVWFYKEKKT